MAVLPAGADLVGDHQETFLGSFDDAAAMRQVWRAGRRETLLSYPLDKEALLRADFDGAQAMMRAAEPPADIAFLRSLENAIVIGDYLFVHAGIRPGSGAAEQRASDLRWIREPLSSHGEPHKHMVVRGHPIAAEPQIRRNRIGLGTGACASGRLCAIALKGAQRCCPRHGSARTRALR